MPPNQRKPVLSKYYENDKAGTIPRAKTNSIKWSFSFRYFNQMEFFGLDVSKADAIWFVSLLDRLKELSSYELDKFLSDTQAMKSWRYHVIKWDAKNIPIRRTDINWVDKHIIENETEFPFWQFMISKAVGRVVGFWDENNEIFNIVLLDPMHNIQPSKDYNYQVTDTRIMPSKYNQLLEVLEDIKNMECHDDCKAKRKAFTIPNEYNSKNILHAFIDDSYIDAMNGKTLTQIIEAGIEFLETNK